MSEKAYVISIDPGNDGCGVALWTLDGKLERAGYARPTSVKSPWPAERWLEVSYAVAVYAGVVLPEEVVMEVPQVYPDDPVPPNDLITLAACAGVVIGMLRPVRAVRYLPREWKGQVPKAVTTARTQAKLSAEELLHVSLPAPSLQHNVWDAVGIGLHHMKQMRRRV